VVKSFSKAHGAYIIDAVGPVDYEKEFLSILSKTETSKRRSRGGGKHQSQPKQSRNKKQNGNPASSSSEEEIGEDEDEDEDEEDGDNLDAGVNADGENSNSDEHVSDSNSNSLDAKIEAARARLERRAALRKSKSQGKGGGAPKPKSKNKTKSPKREKEKRIWGERELSKEEAAALDKSNYEEPIQDMDKALESAGKHYMPDTMGEKADLDKDDEDDYTDSDADFDDSSAQESSSSWGITSKFSGFLKNLTGQKPLTREDLDPALKTMKDHLVSKNVALDVATEIIESVAAQLEGEKLGSFTRGVNRAVREALEVALERILIPKRSTDILREVKAAKEKGESYSIVFIGVNGVGKSTSLSKVAYYLQNNGLKVMLCACDTFRSGAVEQLKVHSRNLDCPLYEQGYAKDPASVAMGGIKYANENKFDVILIDTAGRMQNNAPLMRALTKLVALNRPNLVLFVGEALVGNDGVDQLKLFNKALHDYSDSSNPRLIDGMILTKFDTIDDKVGAAVSMVHNTGQPIMFVGTGQKYTNLNKLNVKKVLRALVT